MSKITAAKLAELLGPRPCLTRTDLARHFGCSLRTIDRWKQRRRLPRPRYMLGVPLWTPAQIANLDLETYERD